MEEDDVLAEDDARGGAGIGDVLVVVVELEVEVCMSSGIGPHPQGSTSLGSSGLLPEGGSGRIAVKYSLLFVPSE